MDTTCFNSSKGPFPSYHYETSIMKDRGKTILMLTKIRGMISLESFNYKQFYNILCLGYHVFDLPHQIHHF
ncbi:hypothetical protein RHMOL_Rhmol02G0081700 [Rhododendron molle]|uniref:Uncharacterized protein n=1 Tax=Rhododendron molle TaxID=49168 RepID=A0ACC0PPJ2_RHOML|nr:hypothetical protein RHMOL_Rhmol02G0081700 [Rhododendron molle]